MNTYSNTGDNQQQQVPSYYENVARLRTANNNNNGGDDREPNNLYANIDSLPLPPPPVMVAGSDSRYYGHYTHTDQADFPPPPPPPNSMEPTSYMNNVGRILSSYKQQQQQPPSLGNLPEDHIYANTMTIGGGDDHLNVNNNNNHNMYSHQRKPGIVSDDIYTQLYEHIDRLNLNNNNNNTVPSSFEERTHHHHHHQPKPKVSGESTNSANIYANTSGGSVARLKSNRLPSKNCSNLLYLRSSSNKTKGEEEVDHLTDLLVKSMENAIEPDFFGMCHKCGEKVVGEGSGCSAMEFVYHVACFKCFECHKELRGKSFYAMESNPFCEECYLNTLEKCCVCEKPILERILRATGKPYHPNCFTCVVCHKCLDGIPFTVDANNQIHCIDDFHKKFAPRCSVCKEPIVPEAGKTETVRVVALDRSFHVSCYKCEDCDLLLSSEAEGRGCYPLDDHILCRNCNTKRVQELTAN